MPLPQHLRLNAFKYPIAFIRLIQLLFIVIALASVNNWSFKMEFSCPDGHVVKTKVSTFSLDSELIESCVPDNVTEKEKHELWPKGQGYSSSSGYFYFVQIVCLVSICSAVFLYVVLWDMYQANGRVRLADLALTALCFVFLFFCSSTWWSSSNGIGDATSQQTLEKLLSENKNFWDGSKHSLSRDTSNGKLTISVLCEWVCVVLFSLNCWYIWKEIAPTSANNPREIA